MTHLIYNSNQRVANSIALGGSILSLILWIWFAMHYTESWYEYRMSYIFGIGLSFCLPPILRFVKDRTFSPPLFLKAIAGVSKFAYTGYVLHFPFFVLVFVLTNKNVDDTVFRFLIPVVSFIIILIISSVLGKYLENTERIKSFFTSAK